VEFFDERNSLQDQQKVFETDIIGMQHSVKNFEDRINHNKIQRAQISAQIDSINSESKEFHDIEKYNLPTEEIKEKLQKSQFRISRLGNVNLRALEVFDTVEEQVKSIQEKVETINSEKEKIQNIITEIDKKKKKSFLSTLESINELFTRNYSQLSKKGKISLELENKKEPFDGGLNILVKVSRGKYFDINSLSGGEKTMVALSLIFAIQEYKPYSFYILDEIDAALDKHNSELLAALIKKYMTTGQYIIVTHNDTLISSASNLYGVSMQENISKIISLKV
jgi:chromosome segregation protein